MNDERVLTPASAVGSVAPPLLAAKLVVLRTPSGISGDMLVTGLSILAEVSGEELNSFIEAIGIKALHGGLVIRPHSVNSISGWKAEVVLPSEHAHRSFSSIVELIERSALSDPAKQLATSSFRILAEAEARVHDIDISDVVFHEVGALDSILDTCLAAALFTRITPKAFHCSPLPLCDGVIRCAHGPLASPAPAVQEMLIGIPVHGIPSRGETVTPTALAFLKSAGAIFGDWPPLDIEHIARVYGSRVLPGVPNGAIFAIGTERAQERRHVPRDLP